MAQFSSGGKINYNALRNKIEAKTIKIKNKIAEDLQEFGVDVLENKLQKRIQSGGMWVIDKRGIEKSLLSILKWRCYVERRGNDSILLMFRNDAINTRKGGKNARYAKYLVGEDGLYKSEGQGLTKEVWNDFKSSTKKIIKDIISGQNR